VLTVGACSYGSIETTHRPRGDRRTYINDGGTWVPDATGLLGDLVRYFDEYKEVAEADVMQMKMRIAVETVGPIVSLLGREDHRWLSAPRTAPPVSCRQVQLRRCGEIELGHLTVDIPGF
jgi:hypothetical protein